MIVTPITLLSGATGTGASATVITNKFNAICFHVFGSTSAGAGSATVKVEVSNDGTNYFQIKSFSLTLVTTVSSDAYELPITARYLYIRGNVTAISGTGAQVTLIAGV